MHTHVCMYMYIYIYIYIHIHRAPFPSAPREDTVSFHNFKSQNFKSSVSNPKSKYVAYLSVLSKILNCQGLGRNNKLEILKTDRMRGLSCFRNIFRSQTQLLLVCMLNYRMYFCIGGILFGTPPMFHPPPTLYPPPSQNRGIRRVRPEPVPEHVDFPLGTESLESPDPGYSTI